MTLLLALDLRRGPPKMDSALDTSSLDGRHDSLDAVMDFEMIDEEDSTPNNEPLEAARDEGDRDPPPDSAELELEPARTPRDASKDSQSQGDEDDLNEEGAAFEQPPVARPVPMVSRRLELDEALRPRVADLLSVASKTIYDISRVDSIAPEEGNVALVFKGPTYQAVRDAEEMSIIFLKHFVQGQGESPRRTLGACLWCT
jgi:hypothetical protein